MFNEFANEVLNICQMENLTNERKIERIISMTNEYLLKYVKEKGTVKSPKGLKKQIKAFESFMKDLQTSSAYMKYGEQDILPYKVFVDENKSISATGLPSFFGCPYFVFNFERNSEFISNLPPEYIDAKDREHYQMCFNLFDKMTKKKRKFKVTIKYEELLVAKNLGKESAEDKYGNKFLWAFEKSIVNVSDSEDVLHRWFNAYGMIRIFNILGVDEIDFYATEDYRDGFITYGYNDCVGNYSVVSTFLGGVHLSKYSEEAEKRREKIEAQKNERQAFIKKGKAGKLKFTKLEIPDFPVDEDVPF